MPSAASSNPVAIMLTLLPPTTRRLRHNYTRYARIVAMDSGLVPCWVLKDRSKQEHGDLIGVPGAVDGPTTRAIA